MRTDELINARDGRVDGMNALHARAFVRTCCMRASVRACRCVGRSLGGRRARLFGIARTHLQFSMTPVPHGIPQSAVGQQCALGVVLLNRICSCGSSRNAERKSLTSCTLPLRYLPGPVVIIRLFGVVLVHYY